MQPAAPQERGLLELFRLDIAACKAGVAALDALLRDFRQAKVRATAIHEIEREGDAQTAAVFALLRSAAPLPLERADAIALGSIIDDVLDGVDEVAIMLVLYGVSQPSVYLLEANSLLCSAVDALSEAIDRLDTLEGIVPFVQRVHDLETEADGLYHNAIAELFLPNAYSAVDVVRWKSIYDLMEQTLDKCEDVSNVLENLVLTGR